MHVCKSYLLKIHDLSACSIESKLLAVMFKTTLVISLYVYHTRQTIAPQHCPFVCGGILRFSILLQKLYAHAFSAAHAHTLLGVSSRPGWHDAEN
jgi:hypothetical protein